MNADFVAFDMDWKPQVIISDPIRPALIKICSKDFAFIIDVLPLASSTSLDSALTTLFKQEKQTVLAFGF
jgi:hypothetical protein